MSECNHEWQLGISKQYTWVDNIYGAKKTIFGNPKVSNKRVMRGRIDEYFCCKCLEKKIDKRESASYDPMWFMDSVETEHSEYGRPNAMWMDSENGR